MSKRAVIFDYGGVIQQTQDYTPRHRWDDQLSLKHGSVERTVHNDSSWRLVQLGRTSMEAYWQDIGQRLSLNAKETAQLAADFYAGDIIAQDVIETIKTLRTDGHIVGLLSNNSPDLADIMRGHGIADLFDPLIVSADIGVMKPDAAAYQAVLDRINRPPDSLIFIDDNAVNIKAAQELGIHALLYTPGLPLQTALADLLTDD